jgi:hypothetical protein
MDREDQMRTRIGKVRRVVALATAAAAAAGVLVAAPLSSQAQAYDANDCGSSYDTDVDQLSVDTGTSGKVDFGDSPHWGGVPRGTAAVCWADGRNAILIKAKTFWDTESSGCGWVQYRIYNTAGTRLYTHDSAIVCDRSSNEAEEVNSHLNLIKGMQGPVGTGDYDRVRIALYRYTSTGGTTEIFHTNRYFGD